MIEEELTIARKVELENWVKQNLKSDKKLTERELTALLRKTNFSEEEINYLRLAYYMPYEEVAAELIKFEESGFTSNYQFAYTMRQKYGYNYFIINRRLSDVRMMKYFLNQNEEQVYHKLVRDNIDGIIEHNGEVPITRILSDEEYWIALMAKDLEELEEVKKAQTPEEIKGELVDKLTVLKAMIEFQGFNLADIIQTEIIKTMDRGGFKRKLFLEKVVTKKN